VCPKCSENGLFGIDGKRAKIIKSGDLGNILHQIEARHLIII